MEPEQAEAVAVGPPPEESREGQVIEGRAALHTAVSDMGRAGLLSLVCTSRNSIDSGAAFLRVPANSPK